MQCLMYEIHLDFVKFRLLVCNSVIVIFAPEDTIQTCAGKLVSADAGVILSSQGVVPYFQTRNSGEPGSFKFPSAIVYATSDSSGTIPCISKLSPYQAAYHFLAGYQNGKFVPAYSDSPSIDTLEFAKALSSEICKSIHLFMLKDNQIPSLLVNVKEGERSLTGKLWQSFEGLSCNKKNLKIFHSDPFDYHSIMDALKGCCGLFYSFEPPSDQPTYDEFMADVEVRAAHNVLEACAQTNTIDKVVFTSSATTVIWNDSHRKAPDLDERNWSDLNFCRKFKLWQALSKTLAEKTAWALAMDRSINMVTVNGGLLMSPDLTISNPYLKGAAEMYEDGVFVTVDLRFIVDTHIHVFEDATSYGRYLCFNHVIKCNGDAVKLANMLLPPSESSLPQSLEDTRIHQQRISNKKLNKLMVDFDTKLRVD